MRHDFVPVRVHAFFVPTFLAATDYSKRDEGRKALCLE